MEYLTVKESAKKWGLSIRAVQQLCEQGRIPGIQKFGKSWAIPAEAEKPEGVRPRNGENTGSQASSSGESPLIDIENLMPLMNTPFQPGHCLEAIAAMPTGLKRDIAMAEYYYFSGQAEMAVRQAKLFLDHEDQGAQLSACLIYAYANLTLGEIPRARFALGELNAALSSEGGRNPQFRTTAAFVASAASVLLHLPLPDKMPETKSFFGLAALGD